MNLTLKNKNIIVTGASSGIGRQCAVTLSQLDANIILIARNEERLKETYQQLKKGNHLYYSQDITDYEVIEQLISKVAEEHGKIFGFVHSAGIEKTLPFRNMKPLYYEELYAVNVIAGFEIARVIAKKQNIEESGASFIYIASVMGILGQVGKVGYCSSKGALIAGSRAMSLELAVKNIRVNSILPGIVETELVLKMFESYSDEAIRAIKDMHPLGLGNAADVANMCAFLISDHARWITGSNIVIDGGYSAK